MNQQLRLVPIPENKYNDYRYDVIFNAYKWDPQVGDHNTISDHVVLMERKAAQEIKVIAEQMARETVAMEQALLSELPLAKELGYPTKIYKALHEITDYSPDRHVRLMRFDFHPTADGWAVSEVNSDVPGGFAESSVFPKLAARYFPGYQPYGHSAEGLYKAFKPLLKKDEPLAFVHATSYSDDRQEMEFLSDYFRDRGYDTLFVAPDHLRWKDYQAVSTLNGAEGPVGGIIRFYPLEWLENLPGNYKWKGYYTSQTPSCNHPTAILTQSKRLPLIWDQLGCDISGWKEMLPLTKDPKSVQKNEKDWIYKPALGRVGEGISIKDSISQKDYDKIVRMARKHPKEWIAQKMFHSQPLIGIDQRSYHLCVGVFVINGCFSGFYGRVSPFSRIDERAKDIPVLIAEGD